MSEDVNSSQQGPQPGFSERSSGYFRGGVTIAIVALLLLLSTFYISSPTVPRILSIALGILGVATAAGFVPIKAPQDYYGGLVLVMLAIVALVASADLPGQRGFAFGPGTAPRLFSGILALLGIAVAASGVIFDGPRIEEYKLRGPTLVIIAILLFALMIRPFGLVVATYTAFMISILGSKEMRWIESLIAAAVMTGFCVVLFVYLLNLPFQLRPPSNAGQLMYNQFADLIKGVNFVLQKLAPGWN
jgi:hypothetical protein